MHIYFSLFCALTIWKGYILISVNCNTVWLHKGPSILNLELLLFFGTGSHWLWTCRDSWFFSRWVLRLTILFLTKSLLILHDDVEPGIQVFASYMLSLLTDSLVNRYNYCKLYRENLPVSSSSTSSFIERFGTLLVFQNSETAAILVYQDNPGGVEFFSYANAFFCSIKFA